MMGEVEHQEIQQVVEEQELWEHQIQLLVQ
jgi:hypothetical protein